MVVVAVVVPVMGIVVVVAVAAIHHTVSTKIFVAVALHFFLN